MERNLLAAFAERTRHIFATASFAGLKELPA